MSPRLVAALFVVGLILFAIEIAFDPHPIVFWATWAVWGAFVAEFAWGCARAESRKAYLRANWLTVLTLGFPVLRVFRVFGLVRWLRPLGHTRSARIVKSGSTARRARRLRRPPTR